MVPRNIPSSVRKLETLAKYIEVGDELRCQVEPRQGPGLAFQEEAEDGTLEQVTINPAWLATTAVKIQATESPEKNKKSPEKLGDFLKEKSSVDTEKSSPEKEEVNPFYSEGDDEEEEEEDKLPEPVSVIETETEDEENNKKASVLDEGDHNGVEKISEDPKSPKVAEKESKICTISNGVSKEDEEEEADGDNTADEDMLELEANPDEFEDMDIAKAATPPTEVEVIDCEDEGVEEVAVVKKAGAVATEVGEPLPPGEEVAAISLPVEEVEAPGEEAVRARLVQFKKSSSVGARGKVVSAVAEVVEGEGAGQRVTLAASCLYAWGHHLAKANLMYHLRLHEPLLLDLQPRCLTPPSPPAGRRTARPWWRGGRGWGRGPRARTSWP